MKTSSLVDTTTDTALELVDGLGQKWVQAQVETQAEHGVYPNYSRVSNDLEVNLFPSEYGHRMDINRNIYVRLTDEHRTTVRAKILDHAFTLLELKQIRDALTLFIDTDEQGGFDE